MHHMVLESSATLGRENKIPVCIHRRHRTASADGVVVPKLARQLAGIDKAGSGMREMQDPITARQRDGGARCQCFRYIDHRRIVESRHVPHATEGCAPKAGKSPASAGSTASAEPAASEAAQSSAAKGAASHCAKSERTLRKVTGRITNLQNTPAPQHALIEIQTMNLSRTGA